MISKWIFCLFISLAGGFLLFAQDISPEPDFRSFIESTFSSDDEMISDDVYESFLQLYYHPINLNRADREDLQSLLLLSDLEIAHILDHRSEYGSFLSFQELYLVEGMDSSKIDQIRVFLTVEPSPAQIIDSLPMIKRIFRYGESSLIFRYSRILEGRKGFENRNKPEEILKNRYYTGTPDQLYVRFSLEVPNDLKVGLTAEKDAGEMIYFAPGDKSYGFDHYAGFIQKKYHSWLKNITVGDFQIHSGQGLVMGNGLFAGKGTEPIRTSIRNDQGLRTYQGATEYNFFRGVAVGLGGRKWAATTFFSHKGLDANLEAQDGIEEPEVIRSILKTGYHRTPTELEKKNAVKMSSYGFMYRYQSTYRNLSLGISGIWNLLSLPVREIAKYYNYYDFSGRKQFNVGINYNYYKGKFSIFGELAYAGDAGLGIVQGLVANLSSTIETALHLRYYGKRYYSVTGRAFGEYALNNNEQGIYWGLKIRPLARTQIHFFFDIFRSEWLRNGAASPGTGYEWMIYLKYSPGSYSGIDITYREEHKGKNYLSGQTPEYSVSLGSRRKLRLNYQYGAERGILLRSRVQGDQNMVGANKTFGFAIIQDMGFKTSWGYLKGSVSYFQTGDYQTRQFVYEPDVLYYFSVPAYYGQGIRYFMLLKVRPHWRMDCWIKCGQFYFFGQDTIGNGLDEISGNKKTEIRCQFRIKF